MAVLGIAVGRCRHTTGCAFSNASATHEGLGALLGRDRQHTSSPPSDVVTAIKYHSEVIHPVVWRPLHMRQQDLDDGPYEDVPAHLQGLLWEWCLSMMAQGTSLSTLEVHDIAMRARIPVPQFVARAQLLNALRDQCIEDGYFLSLIDAILHKNNNLLKGSIGRLEEHLALGGSAWMVAWDGLSLVRRVDPEAMEAVVQATSPNDPISDELAEAWRKCYGIDPDPSDAWDHSIKAAEHILKPIVSPRNDKATLGTIIRDLRAGSAKFAFALAHDDGSDVARLISTLELMWPNPDRHGSGSAKPIDLARARAVVHLAVTVVQWGRAGLLRKGS